MMIDIITLYFPRKKIMRDFLRSIDTSNCFNSEKNTSCTVNGFPISIIPTKHAVEILFPSDKTSAVINFIDNSVEKRKGIGIHTFNKKLSKELAVIVNTREYNLL